MIFGDDNVTTGASNDFMQVSRVARQMIERFGFSKKIGQVAVGGPGGNPFMGQQVYIPQCLFCFHHYRLLLNLHVFFVCRCLHRKTTQWQLLIS